MSNKKYSFKEFLEEQGNIRIPKIQRDYAQGRLSKDVDEIRKNFVHTLMLVIKGKRSETELDFIYGSTRNDAFEPLDGQQRLTTLFLLHWFFGIDLRSKNDNTRSKFTYETRNTSVEFCDELVQHKSNVFVAEANLKGKEPSDIIKARDWFKWEWKYDPTISSMLVMVDSISNELDDNWEVHLSEYQKNLSHITFNRLNLGEFGLSDELFIKMNARGKLLSDFDKLKSSLEEELQLQEKEKDEDGNYLATSNDENIWRTLVDGAWIDMFWHKYARQTIEDTIANPTEDSRSKRLKAAQLSETQFKKLILRLISIELLENDNDNDKLVNTAYSLNEDLLYYYSDSLSDLRSNDTEIIIPKGKSIIRFDRLISDINSLIYKDSTGTYYETTFLLPQNSHIGNNGLSLFDSFLVDGVGNDVELVFYAMLLFLRAFPMKREGKDIMSEEGFVFNHAQHEVWVGNLGNWVRAFRNTLLNDNNNQRIDKPQRFFDAIGNVQKLSGSFVKFVSNEHIDIENDKFAVQKFFTSLEKTNSRKSQALQEEIDKAKLQIEDVAWSDIIKSAESQNYLWGQIRCLLSWSDGSLSTFKIYKEHLSSLLDYMARDDRRIKIYALELALFPDFWKDSNRLYVYNMDRDNSFKRYLRDASKENNNICGYYFKKLIDTWINDYDDCSIEQFAERVVSNRLKDAEPWLESILRRPSILEYAYNRRIFLSHGHVVLAQRKTLDSHLYDPVFLYLRDLCRLKHMKEKQEFDFYDSKSDYKNGHAFYVRKDDKKYVAEWSDSDDGLYSLSIDNEKQDSDLTSRELFDKITAVINN